MFALTWRTLFRGRGRSVLIALLAICFAAPAAAGTIVGRFTYEVDSGFCDIFPDPGCEPFRYFTLENNATESLAGLMFSASIEIGGITYDFIDTDPLVSGTSTLTNALAPPPFAPGATAALLFTGDNAADYFGTLVLSPVVLHYPESSSPPFAADVVFTPNAVTEAPSWLVVVIGIGALAAGRLFVA